MHTGEKSEVYLSKDVRINWWRGGRGRVKHMGMLGRWGEAQWHKYWLDLGLKTEASVNAGLWSPTLKPPPTKSKYSPCTQRSRVFVCVWQVSISPWGVSKLQVFTGSSSFVISLQTLCRSSIIPFNLLYLKRRRTNGLCVCMRSGVLVISVYIWAACASQREVCITSGAYRGLSGRKDEEMSLLWWELWCQFKVIMQYKPASYFHTSLIFIPNAELICSFSLQW